MTEYRPSTMTTKQAQAASSLELGLADILAAIGPAHSAFILVDAIGQARLPVKDLRFVSRMLDRLADKIERDAPSGPE